MTVRNILQIAQTGKFGNVKEEVLRRRTVLAKLDEDVSLAVILDLVDTMRAQRPLCVGLAAPQIGSNLRIAVIADGDNQLILINPEILSTSGKKDVKRESCMSIWGLTAPVERRDKVEVRFEDENGAAVTRKFTGFTARVVQHEIDHLNGILFDKLALEKLTPSNVFEGFTPSKETF